MKNNRFTQHSPFHNLFSHYNRNLLLPASDCLELFSSLFRRQEEGQQVLPSQWHQVSKLHGLHTRDKRVESIFARHDRVDAGEEKEEWWELHSFK